MGYAMAKNIRKKMAPTGTLYVFDVFGRVCEKFRNEFKSFGPIVIVESPKEAAAMSQTIISIVPGAKEVRDVYLNDLSGVIAAPKNEDRLIMECSTIDSQSSREVGQALRTAGAGTYIDTPVSVNPLPADGILAQLSGFWKRFLIDENAGRSSRCRFRNINLLDRAHQAL
jgi:3-hydroxyisobutyrate dehydrogenase and related beta-hydroxyacid dehydrogenases